MSCPNCFAGHINPSTPTGHVTTLHGLDVYIAEPPENTEPKGIIVIIPDAFGWEFVNNRILADHYAQRGGFRVLLPDFMKGTAAPVYMLDAVRGVMATGSLWDWVVKPYANPLSHCFISTILVYTQRAVPRVTCHPSFLSVPGDIEKLVVPVSFALAELDSVLKGESIGVVKRVVEEKEEVGGEVRVYPRAGHGFCVRADTAVPDSSRQAEEAEEQAIAFFQRVFGRRT
ncbi:hypothetical protein ASPCAL13813 [Aspergillus calidoustus]|uniref:Dienelactone hydrolase domain-containing protein n=1 Tax=Aspergillus calidoustus TaxID=454130 RepID=A0A0U5CIJ3_ASPCI|nr:hypothetical protein ASPCAL13813 [Aspergillus calidoustus]